MALPSKKQRRVPHLGNILLHSVRPVKSSLWSPWDRHLVIWSNCPGLAVNHSLSSFIVVQSWELTSEVGTCKCSDLDVELRSNLGMAGSENGIICHWKWFMDPKLLESWLIHHNPFIFHIRPFPRVARLAHRSILRHRRRSWPPNWVCMANAHKESSSIWVPNAAGSAATNTWSAAKLPSPLRWSKYG